MDLIPSPPTNFEGEAFYELRPREKRTFHTVLDAAKLLDSDRSRRSHVRWTRSDGGFELHLEHPLRSGRTTEQVHFESTAQGILLRRLTRKVFDVSDAQVRLEAVDFGAAPMRLPDQTYPEVVLPFILGWMPADKTTRSVYAWINDRFVSKVYVESQGPTHVKVLGRKRAALEVLMYPDLNDWVSLGPVLTRLAKPLVPKYRMWFDPEPPHRPLRYEGPYGPPGAPEIVIELSEQR
ncbi:MAG: hypothetical protein AAGF12_34360 [Myxococcota bacterium]